jgi:hypothetical protein
MRPGTWDASEGEVSNGVLIMKPTRRRVSCCGQPLELLAEASRGSLRWGLWRCTTCEQAYSIGPKLPDCWVHALARACIELYETLQAEIDHAYRD